ncbi:hypothetical protein SBA4_4360007 [Candidatus Sulfopaludibacter sp. SbA4]|nr:hypothetical protein SBA4_4360007 [Candidatus Sulfopaludibacter sp. SbA4]
MEGHRFEARQMAALNRVGRLAQKVDLPLEGRDAGKNKMAIGGIVLITGFVQVEDVHKKRQPAARTSNWSQNKGTPPVANSS